MTRKIERHVHNDEEYFTECIIIDNDSNYQYNIINVMHITSS